MHNPPLVLIADDNSDFREILSTKLKQSGFWVAEAKDGAEAVLKAQSLQPDLIVMDIQMPNENGTEAVLDLKRNPVTKDTKIVFFTSLENPWPGIKAKNEKFAEELGAAQFINKADDLDQMAKKIQEIIGAPDKK